MLTVTALLTVRERFKNENSDSEEGTNHNSICGFTVWHGFLSDDAY
jgi:hypothetical protein